MRPTISFDRSSLAQTTAVSLATLAALALLGIVLAYWTWLAMGPRPEPSAPALAGGSLGLEPAYRLFGVAPQGPAAATTTGVAMELLGVVAASHGNPGYAVLQLESKRVVAVREGELIEPGITLAEVHPHQVVLERGGARETLAFPQTAKTK